MAAFSRRSTAAEIRDPLAPVHQCRPSISSMIADIFWAPAFNRAFDYTSALSVPLPADGSGGYEVHGRSACLTAACQLSASAFLPAQNGRKGGKCPHRT